MHVKTVENDVVVGMVYLLGSNIMDIMWFICACGRGISKEKGFVKLVLKIERRVDAAVETKPFAT